MKKNLSASKTLSALILPTVLLLLWWALTREGGVPPLLLPSPERVATRAWQLLISGELFRHAGASMARVFVGFFLSATSALALALFVMRYPRAGGILSLTLNALRVIPPLSLVPLLILWLGIDEAPKIAIVILASFFPVYLSALSAMQGVRDTYRELAAVFRLTERQTVRHILLPGAAPGVITGLRLGFGYAWRALVGAELIAAASGLGYLIEDASLLARTDVVIVGILAIALLGILCDALFGWVTTHLAPGEGPRKGSKKDPKNLRLATKGTPAPQPPVEQNLSSPTLPGIEIKDLSVTYGAASEPALKGLSLTVAPGAVTAILGRSGCGKTTLLRAVAGLLPKSAKTSGEIAFTQTPQTPQTPTRLSMVFQEPTLLPWKSVAENVALALLADGPVEHPEEDPRVQEALALVGLSDRANDRPAALSGGQKQRVGFARAIAARPEVLLMDEPFGALDALTRHSLQDESVRVFAQRHMTVLMITHDVREAVRMADRAVVVSKTGVVVDSAISLARPRRLSDQGVARLEEGLLEVLMRPER